MTLHSAHGAGDSVVTSWSCSFQDFLLHICVKMVYTQKSDKKILFIETNGDDLQTQEVKL